MMILLNKKNKEQLSYKLKLVMAVVLLLSSTLLMAQTPIGLGSKMASPNSVAHMGTKGGLIIPKVSLTSATAFLAGKTATTDDVSMLVYNTNTATSSGLSGSGFYHWTGSAWVRFNQANDTPISVFPTGMIMPYAGATAPAGWLLCDGGAISGASGTALRALVGNNTPDLRNRFLRGAKGLSSGNGPTLGDMQSQSIKGHQHNLKVDKTVTSTESGQHNHIVLFEGDRGTFPGSIAGRTDAEYVLNNRGDMSQGTGRTSSTDGNHEHQVPINIDQNTESFGATETRPDNYGVNYIIKL